ncbi:MAG: transposase [Gammaproteobacteria bacterium]|nr:transposase [Gammaproteobacteria bacterium]
MARKHYALEYREQIFALVTSGRSITSVAKEFGLADHTVRNWLKEAQEGPLGWPERPRY